VTALRAGDRAAEVRPGAAARQSPAATLTVLREAAETGSTVWIGYVDKDGSALDRLVDPQRVEGGWLRAFDQRSHQVRSFAVHRISSVRPV
jgi:predicted DNA-binding transcriptional regulator YafY